MRVDRCDDPAADPFRPGSLRPCLMLLLLQDFPRLLTCFAESYFLGELWIVLHLDRTLVQWILTYYPGHEKAIARSEGKVSRP